METDATDDQRALLEVSSRFMEDVCPLRAVRDGAWKDADFAAAYRKQAAELGWFSMLVPEALGGGSVSGDGAARRRADRLPARARCCSRDRSSARTWSRTRSPRPGSESARATVLPALLSGEAPASWAVDAPGPRLDAGVEARRARRRGPRADRRQARRAGRRDLVVAAGDVRDARRSGAGARRRRRAGSHRDGARLARPQPPLRRGLASTTPASTPRRSSARPARPTT